MGARAVWSSFKQQAIQFIADPQWIIPSIILPFIFTAIMLMMYPNKSDTIVLTAIIGGGVLGMWGNTLFASSSTMSYDRMNGTMESHLISPTNLFYVLLGRTFWNAFIGIINMIAVFIFAEIVFQTLITIVSPLAFIVAFVLTLFSLASVGMVLSMIFVFSRKSYILTGILEYPIYVLSGALVPITMLPAWTNPISMAFPVTWGIEALRQSAIVGYQPVFGFDLAGNCLVCLLISLLFMIISWFALKRVVSLVRATGSFVRY